MKNFNTIALAGAALLSFSAIGCKKDTHSTLRIYLTSTPVVYDEVNLEVKQIWVRLNKENTGWFLLQQNSTVYNTQKLVNGRDTLIALGVLPKANIKELRFVIGEKNNVTDAGRSYPLSLPQDFQDGVVMTIVKPLTKDFEELKLQFDAAKSVIKYGSKEFSLKPIITISNN